MGIKKKITIEQNQEGDIVFKYENVSTYNEVSTFLRLCNRDARLKLSKGIPLDSNSVSPTVKRAQS